MNSKPAATYSMESCRRFCWWLVAAFALCWNFYVFLRMCQLFCVVSGGYSWATIKQIIDTSDCTQIECIFNNNNNTLANSEEITSPCLFSSLNFQCCPITADLAQPTLRCNEDRSVKHETYVLFRIW